MSRLAYLGQMMEKGGGSAFGFLPEGLVLSWKCPSTQIAYTFFFVVLIVGYVNSLHPIKSQVLQVGHTTDRHIIHMGHSLSCVHSHGLYVIPETSQLTTDHRRFIDAKVTISRSTISTSP